MSEPRKLYTGSASGGLDQEQYEAARHRAQQLAEQNARRRAKQIALGNAQKRRTGFYPKICCAKQFDKAFAHCQRGSNQNIFANPPIKYLP